jgi:rubrerythrin
MVHIKSSRKKNERMRTNLTHLKWKCIAQPSQDNHDDMVKKLETGITMAYTRSLEEKVKDLRNVKRKEQKKKINTSAKSLNRASIQGNIQASERQRKKKSSKHEDRLCYICRKKGHLCKDCPIGNFSTPSLSIDSYVTRQPKIATCARKSNEFTKH